MSKNSKSKINKPKINTSKVNKPKVVKSITIDNGDGTTTTKKVAVSKDAEFYGGFKTDEQYLSELKKFDSRRKKNAEVRIVREILNEYFGSFIHIRYDYKDRIFKELCIDEEIPLTHIGRLIILSHYVLSPKSRRKYCKKDLPDIWDITNRNEINKTFNLLLKYGYIKLNKDGDIMINDDIIKVGSGFKTKYPETYTRVFCEPNIDFYEGLPKKQKKYYGLIIAILPYVNFTHNVLCNNPTESDIDKLELLDWKDLCDIVGYDESHSARLRKELIKLMVYDSEVFMEHSGAKGIRITINPSLYYAGNNPDDLQYLINLFKMTPKNRRKKNK